MEQFCNPAPQELAPWADVSIPDAESKARLVPSQLVCVERCFSREQTMKHRSTQPSWAGADSSVGRAFWFLNMLPPGQARVGADRGV
jgi:hypothetical protein